MIKFFYLFLMTLICTSSSLAQNFPVGHTTITFNDPARTGGFGSGGGPGRQIQTEIYYPAVSAGNNTALATGSFPIIVFGHGFAMSWDAYQNLWEDFASKGYIIAFPRTEGSLIPAPSHNNFGLDLALVEVKLQNLNNNVSSLFYQKVASKSAIMGHSMGGGATFIAAANNSSPSLKAVVGLAPAETNPSAISAAQNVIVDALILSGSSDAVTPPSANHLPIYNNLSSTCKTFLSITNGSHCYFANSNFNCDFGELTTGTGSLSRGAQQDITSDFVTLWLDFELKSSCVSWDEFLDSLAVSTRVVEQQICNYGYLQPQVSITGNSSFCQGGNTLLQASQNSSYSYSWFLDNTAIGINADSLSANVAGDYLVSASNTFGCIDSSSYFTLNTNPIYFIEDTVYACTGSNYTFPDGFTSAQNTTHISQLNSSLNCDSSVSRTVLFGSEVLANEQVNLCAGTSFVINGIAYNSDTSVLDTLVNGSTFGCDSITNYTITVRQPDSTIIEAAICQGENYQLESGLFINQAGLYPTSYTNQFGCDSIFAVDLIVGTPIPTLTIQFYDFTSNNIGETVYLVLMDSLDYDSLVWTTDNNSTLLSQSGDTAYFVWDSVVGSYEIGLTVYRDGCSTFGGTSLAVVGIKDVRQNAGFTLYPNPTSGVLQIKSEQALEFIQIYNLLGDLVFSKISNENMQGIDCSNLANGVYVLKTALGITSFVKE